MVKLLIIADDFTGALDTGIQFKKYGICTQVFTKTRIEDNEINPDTEVLVIDSESRPLTKEEAYLEVLNITKWAISKGIEIIFKKTDSALRGNIGAELKAVADAAGEENLFFMPGYPEIHRITKNGMHYIDGELLENSVFGKDPFEPVKRSYIPDAVLQGYDGYKEGLGMFDTTKIMLPAAIVQIIFWGTIGYTLLTKVLKPESPDFNVGNMYADAPVVEEKNEDDAVTKRKGNIAAFTMLLCIFLFVVSGFEPFKNHFNIGVIGMLGAAIVLGTKCLPVKKAYSELPWDVLITIGGIGGLGTGLDVSGGGALIANAVLNLFGGKNASVVVLTIVIAVLTSVLTNFMSNNATAAMLSPICIAMALSLGISPLPWVIVIAACSNLAIATSYGTAVNMQILPAGYKFSDFVKIGGPLLIILIVVVTASSLAFLF